MEGARASACCCWLAGWWQQRCGGSARAGQAATFAAASAGAACCHTCTSAFVVPAGPCWGQGCGRSPCGWGGLCMMAACICGLHLLAQGVASGAWHPLDVGILGRLLQQGIACAALTPEGLHRALATTGWCAAGYAWLAGVELRREACASKGACVMNPSSDAADATASCQRDALAESSNQPLMRPTPTLRHEPRHT